MLVIVGPTGSGKTGLAIEVAKILNGEVISADSRAIYKGMDIGTAKPTIAEMDGVPHFGIDLVEPDERFTVVDFVRYAKQKIAEIRERGRLPIIAGGTGLYVDSLVFNYQFDDVVKKTCSDREEMSSDYIIVGINWPREKLRERLLIRSNKLFEQNIEAETLSMVEKYGWDSQAMKSDIYPICWEMMRGNISREEAIRLNAIDDWHLAKRQLTWFSRNKNINWLPLDRAAEWTIKYYRG
ncbi:MAG: tRNA (adenosine(37)-N6)-dimethylallyltransferase MiaA [bacterium]|nr:tRNA (adenosine(37)-N6)-dimethylallyltransferase MiaA [bacterium]